MATSRPSPLPYERRLRDLEAIYAQAQQTIAARIELAVRSGDITTAARMRVQLAAVVAALDQLNATVIPLARMLVADAYRDGADRALVEIRRLKARPPEIPGAFAGVHREAVEQLQASLVDRLDVATQTIGRRVEDIYAREQRRAAMRALLGAEGSPQAAARELTHRLMRDRSVRQLVRQGGVGFVDSAGRGWKLDSYAQMAVRTVTREAAVQGAMARMTAHGIDLARVSVHASACEICQPWEGRLIALDGDTAEYDGETVYDDSTIPPFHPNCRHSLHPVAVRIEAIKQQLQAEEA